MNNIKGYISVDRGPPYKINNARVRRKNAKKRFLHALFGAFFGALVALGALYWFDNWIVYLCAGICALLAFVWGEPVLDWLKKLVKDIKNGDF